MRVETTKQIEKLKEKYGDPSIAFAIRDQTFPVGQIEKKNNIIILSQGEKAMSSSDFVQKMKELLYGPDASIAVEYGGKLFLVTGIGVKVKGGIVNGSNFVALTDTAYEAKKGGVNLKNK